MGIWYVRRTTRVSRVENKTVVEISNEEYGRRKVLSYSTETQSVCPGQTTRKTNLTCVNQQEMSKEKIAEVVN